MSRHIYIQKNGGATPVVVAPIVEIVSITNITSNGCTVLARVISDGGSTITSYQFWANSPGNPLVQKSAYPNADGTFSCTFTTLAANVQYSITASVSNSVGSSDAIQYITTSSVAVVPTVRINSVSNITGNSADVACEVLSKGGGTISVSGICWSTSASPTTANSKTTNGITDIGTFISVMTGLQPNTTYYVRAYATNEAGTGYGTDWSILTVNKTLILQFDTNCPSTRVFQATIRANSGIYEWDLGNGIVVKGETTLHTYADSTTKTVKLYCTSGTADIYSISLSWIYIIGEVNLSHTAFSALTDINLEQNATLTSLVLPSVMTASFKRLILQYSGIAGTLNLSAINKLDNAEFWLDNMPATTGLILASSYTGAISTFVMQNTGFIGSLNLMAFTSWASVSTLSIARNPLLTSIIPPADIVGVKLTSGLFIADNTTLGYVKVVFFPSAVNVDSVGYTFVGNNWTSAIVNRVLSEIDAVAVAGYTGRVIWIRYNNSAPDSSSGGYNGLAAKASLTAKGFYFT